MAIPTPFDSMELGMFQSYLCTRETQSLRRFEEIYEMLKDIENDLKEIYGGGHPNST